MLDFFRMMLLNKLFYIFKKKQPTKPKTLDSMEFDIWVLVKIVAIFVCFPSR